MRGASSDPTVIFLMLGGAAAGVAALVRYSRKVLARIAAAWERTASAVGGEFKPAGGPWWSRTAMQIVAQLDGVPLLVDHYTVSHGKSSTTYTRIIAEAKSPPGLTLKIYQEGFFSTIGKVLGAQDVAVGDPAFDDAFIVKASDEDLARLWIGPKVRRAAFGSKEYTLALEGAKVTSIRVGLEADADRLARAIRAAALLAGRGRALLQEWRAVAKELGGDLSTAKKVWPDEPVAIRVEHRGVLLTIDVGRPARARKGAPLCTRVRAKRAATQDDVFTVRRRAEEDAEDAGPFDDPAFAKAYRVEAGAIARVARRFTDELRREILALDPDELDGGEAAVTLTLAGFDLRRKPLERAIGIVAALAAPAPEGPYR